MKTLKRILLFGIIAGVTLFTACEDDDETETLNKEDSKEEIQSNSQTMEKTFSNIQDSEGMKAMESLGAIVNTNDPFNQEKNLAVSQDFITNISEILNPEKVYTEKAGDTQFNFDDHTGIYTWQSDNTWNVDNSPSDAIVIKFPTDTSNFSETGNDGVLTVSNYEEQKITTDTGDTWMPVALNAKLEISGEEYVNVDYSLTLDSDGNPTKVEMSLYMKPYSYEVEFTSNSIMFSLFEDGEDQAIISTDLELTFVSSDMEYVEEINGNLQMGNVNFDGWVKPYALSDTASLVEGTTNSGQIADNMNEQMDIEVNKFDSGEKMADLMFEAFDTTPEYPVTSNITLVFEYNDGTIEEAGPYFESMVTQIENMIAELPEEEF